MILDSLKLEGKVAVITGRGARPGPGDGDSVRPGRS